MYFESRNNSIYGHYQMWNVREESKVTPRLFGLKQTRRMEIPLTEMGKRSRINQFSVIISLIFLLDILEQRYQISCWKYMGLKFTGIVGAADTNLEVVSI